jgi:hypothetical protein
MAAANQAVVGVLRAMLTADTAQFDTGMAKANSTLKLVERNTKQVGVEVQKLTPQAERMVKAFSGDKLLYSANNLVTAITKIGGATKLTEAEQAKANRTLTDAIAKYTALGQKAPPAMVALQKETAGATAQTQRFGMSLSQVSTVLGAFGISLGVSSVVAFGRELLNTADQLVKVADRTGLTTTEVQKLQFIAGQSGNSIDELTGAIGRLQNNLISGEKSAVNAVKVLGINLDALKAASPFEQLQMIATEIAKIPDPAARAAIAIDLFGRTGAAILPTLISDFQKLGEAAPVMSDATVRALDQAGDAIGKFQMQMKVWAAESYNFLGRLFDQFVNFIRRGTASLLDGIAGVMDLQAKIPGVAALWGALGINIDAVRQKAQWFRDAADASAAALNRTDVEVRKNAGSLVDYEALLNKSTGTTKRAATESDKLADAYGRLNSEMANLSGQAFFEHDAELLRQGRVTGDPLAGLSPVNDQIFLPSQRVAGAMGASVPGIGQQRAAELSRVWVAMTEGLTRSIQTMDAAITHSFAKMLIGAESFKDGYLDIWKSIQAGVANILGDILSFFTKQFLGGLIKSLSSANLAQSIGNAIAGGVSGTALGGGASAAGGGAGLAAFATNPFTLAALGGAALGVAIWKGGLFRGGEEATDISPRRDKFFGQLQDMFGGTQFQAAVTASQKAKIPGGAAERMIGAIYRADNKGEYDPAQAAFVSALQAGGLKNVRGFATGGFVPPGVVQPAILHGGRFGEDIVPRTSATLSGSPTLNQHYTVNIHANALNAEGMDAVFARDIVPRLQWEFRLNQRGTITVLEQAMAR